ncbi:MAG TPA: nuclear transport factor 2 family protein [Cyclobacteriaceae bacterium]|nr:nuclear transport factor 2 family protein [Cyclobacteriaceae bacterium]
MTSFAESVVEIKAVVQDYFDGIFYGDLNKLTTAFHPQCLLVGDINGQPYFKNLTDYLFGVKNRKSPNELGEAFRMKILSIETQNEIAVVKLHVPMLGNNYYDYISLVRIDGRWKILNKVFTNIA